MKLTNLSQIVDRLQQAGKIDNLQRVCGVFDFVGRSYGVVSFYLLSIKALFHDREIPREKLFMRNTDGCT